MCFERIIDLVVVKYGAVRKLDVHNHKEEELALAETHEDAQPRNEAMLAVLRRSAERLKNMPFSGSTEDSLKILHEGRAGEMFGYEPTK